MKFEEYKIEASRTLPDLGTLTNDINHMLFGSMTELGEMVDIFKKHHAYGKPIDWAHVKEEYGDLMWYLANLSNILGFNTEEIFQNNIDKLKARFPDKFSQYEALNRDLSKENTILKKVNEND